MNIATEKAYAKINIYLEVLSRLENGYHNIDTLMQTVSLHDNITVEYLQGKEGIFITCTDHTIPTDSSNIVYKCAQSYLEYTGIKAGVNIQIEKNIPSSAGLGGGSADGAAVLRGLNSLCPCPVSVEELCKIGKACGADIPFCVVGGAVRCGGIGDVFSPAPGLFPDLYIVIAKGKQGSNTKEAYMAIDKMANRKIKPMENDLLCAIRENDIKKAALFMYNSFELTVLPKNKEASAIKRSLAVLGASAALMSGSGSAVFGIFESQSKAEQAVCYLEKKGYFSALCRPVNNTFEVK